MNSPTTKDLESFSVDCTPNLSVHDGESAAARVGGEPFHSAYVVADSHVGFGFDSGYDVQDVACWWQFKDGCDGEYE